MFSLRYYKIKQIVSNRAKCFPVKQNWLINWLKLKFRIKMNLHIMDVLALPLSHMYVHVRAVPYSTVHHTSAVTYSNVQSRNVQCSNVQCSNVQCSNVPYSGVRRRCCVIYSVSISFKKTFSDNTAKFRFSFHQKVDTHPMFCTGKYWSFMYCVVLHYIVLLSQL